MDTTHPNGLGNEIISEHMFNQIIEFSSEQEFSSIEIQPMDYKKYSESLETKIYAVNADLSNRSMKNLDLKGAIFFGTNLENTDSIKYFWPDFNQIDCSPFSSAI